jgi:hypothetical protein
VDWEFIKIYFDGDEEGKVVEMWNCGKGIRWGHRSDI